MGDYVHSKQARFDKSPCSCGVTELHHLPDQPPEQTIFAIATHLYHKANGRPSAFLLFSDVVGGQTASRGEVLARAIQDMKVPGSLAETPVTINPRTGNRIRVWLLTLDHDTFRKWYSDEYVNRITE